ncbi:MAG: YceI family protein [Verrucomicrobiaceae bacterium]|nr:YceI family protein [Verrucomicrobiaceae bacterium]
MSPQELQTLLSGTQAPLLVQVLPEEVFTARRIPGSVNACVYEVAFFDQLAAITSDKQTEIVVYGAGGGSLDALVAAEKLKAAGYGKVRAFEGGLEAWSAAGLALEGNGSIPEAPKLKGKFSVDTEQSLIRWTGRNLFNHHHGFIRLTGGEIELRDSQLVAAKLTINMSSIVCEDIPDSAINEMLIKHLESDDFFDVSRFPTAEFEAESAAPIESCNDGSPNFVLRGRFTLRGVTKVIEFPIQVATADGKRLTAQGVLDLDRTEFGSVYGSGRLFRFLGKHIVNDHIHLHLKIHANLES